MTDRTASIDVTCPPDGGGCNDLTATTQRREFGAGVTVLHWPCGHAHVHIATSTDVKVHAPDKSHERRFWHPADHPRRHHRRPDLDQRAGPDDRTDR